MQEKLDAAKQTWIRQRYLTAGGQEVSKSLGTSAERLEKDQSSPAMRETLSAVYHIVSGKGYTTIDRETFQWKQGDTFCLPSWREYQHFPDSAETVYLYRRDDLPMLKALGYYRTEGGDFEEN
ncbi:hypothetical protein LTS15_002098 [Exophiala xenobiotica]|nr:hypothetical protein LTS15_002098 [Exophiala xenobiotica]